MAVLSVLRSQHPHATIHVWCDRAFYAQTKNTIQGNDSDVKVEVILSGKFRRYSSLSIIEQLLSFRTIVLPNIVDIFKIVAATVQSFYKLIRWRPDVIFCKGGFVSLPVGYAASLLRIPVLLHDSDTHPGLANRLLARTATKIATGSTLDHYPYPLEKSIYVGIPLVKEYRVYTEDERQLFKRAIGFKDNKPLVLVTGGGLGSQKINHAVMERLALLVATCNVMLVCGENNYKSLAKHSKTKRYADSFQLRSYVSTGMYKLMAAADLVVTRGGATTLLELAALATPAVIIPNPYLTGSHQLKNAKEYEEEGAAVIVDEYELDKNLDVLSDAIIAIMSDAALQQRLSDSIKRLARPQAAKTVARLIVESIRT